MRFSEAFSFEPFSIFWTSVLEITIVDNKKSTVHLFTQAGKSKAPNCSVWSIWINMNLHEHLHLCTDWV